MIYVSRVYNFSICLRTFTKQFHTLEVDDFITQEPFTVIRGF